jgi:hypothetical protein
LFVGCPAIAQIFPRNELSSVATGLTLILLYDGNLFLKPLTAAIIPLLKTKIPTTRTPTIANTATNSSNVKPDFFLESMIFYFD